MLKTAALFTKADTYADRALPPALLFKHVMAELCRKEDRAHPCVNLSTSLYMKPWTIRAAANWCQAQSACGALICGERLLRCLRNCHAPHSNAQRRPSGCRMQAAWQPGGQSGHLLCVLLQFRSQSRNYNRSCSKEAAMKAAWVQKAQSEAGMPPAQVSQSVTRVCTRRPTRPRCCCPHWCSSWDVRNT